MTHILITGGARGIGRALRVAALAQGSRASSTLRTAEAPAGVTAHHLDLQETGHLATFAQALGPVDVVIYTAGSIGPAPDPLDVSPQALAETGRFPKTDGSERPW